MSRNSWEVLRDSLNAEKQVPRNQQGELLGSTRRTTRKQRKVPGKCQNFWNLHVKSLENIRKKSCEENTIYRYNSHEIM